MIASVGSGHWDLVTGKFNFSWLIFANRTFFVEMALLISVFVYIKRGRKIRYMAICIIGFFVSMAVLTDKTFTSYIQTSSQDHQEILKLIDKEISITEKKFNKQLSLNHITASNTTEQKLQALYAQRKNVLKEAPNSINKTALKDHIINLTSIILITIVNLFLFHTIISESETQFKNYFSKSKHTNETSETSPIPMFYDIRHKELHEKLSTEVSESSQRIIAKKYDINTTALNRFIKNGHVGKQIEGLL